MKKIICSFITLFCLLCAVTVNAAQLSKDTAVAVMDFGTRPGATPAEISLNNAEYTSSEYIIIRLLERNCFNIMDKDFVMNSLNAENIKTTGIIDPDTAKKIGALLNTKYIIYGNVVNVSLGENEMQLLGIGGNVCTIKARMMARVMDVDTGNILMIAKGEGESKSSYVNLALGNDVFTAPVIAFGTIGVTQESVHNAIKKAAYDTVDNLILRLFKEKKPKK